jgi:hypothetical protein
MRLHKRLPPDDAEKRRIVAQVRAGVPRRFIERQHGMSPETIEKIVKELERK